MATIIKPKRSEVASSVPGTGDLAVGELVINSTDKKMYTKKADGTVVDLLSGAGSLTVTDTDVTGVVQTIKFADTIDGLFSIDTSSESGTAIVSLNISADRDYGSITGSVGAGSAVDYGSLA